MDNLICMVIDLDRCWGCRTCEVACKQELGLSVGGSTLQVGEVGPREIDGELHTDYIPLMCQHCDNPTCMEVCPVGAIFRECDGTVQIDNQICIGCGLCQSACSYGAIDVSYSEGQKTAVKCTLCFSRLQSDRLPSCAQHCIGRAFSIVSEKELNNVIDGRYSWSTGRIVYVSSKWSDLGKCFN